MNGDGSRSSHTSSVQFGSFPAFRFERPEANPFIHHLNPRAPEFSGPGRTDSQAARNDTNGRQESHGMRGQQRPNSANWQARQTGVDGQQMANGMNRHRRHPGIQFGQHEHIARDDSGQANGTFRNQYNNGMHGHQNAFGPNGGHAQGVAPRYHNQHNTTNGPYNNFSMNQVSANWGIRGNHVPNATAGFHPGTFMNSPAESSPMTDNNNYHAAPYSPHFNLVGPPPPAFPPSSGPQTHPGFPPPPARPVTTAEAFTQVYHDLHTTYNLSYEEIWAGLGSVRIDLTELPLTPPQLIQAMSTLSNRSGKALLFHPNGSVSATAAGTPNFRRILVGDGRPEECGDDQYIGQMELFDPESWNVSLEVKPVIKWKLPG